MSEKSLEVLINKVKSEAIDVAKKDARQIIAKAKEEAAQLIEDANKQKDSIITNAEKEAEEIISKGKIAMQQAARDVQVSVKNDLLQLFQHVLGSKLEETFSPDLIRQSVKSVVSSIGGEVTIRLPEDTEQKLIDAIHHEVGNGDEVINIMKDNGLLKGLTISKEAEGWSYHITPEEVAQILNDQLSKKWVEIINKT